MVHLQVESGLLTSPAAKPSLPGAPCPAGSTPDHSMSIRSDRCDRATYVIVGGPRNTASKLPFFPLSVEAPRHEHQQCYVIPFFGNFLEKIIDFLASFPICLRSAFLIPSACSSSCSPPGFP